MRKNFGPAVQVRYQVNWPDASDPMNKFAKADVQSRVTYYKVGGTPEVIFDGLSGRPSHAKIFTKQETSAPIKLDVRMNPIADDNILSGDVVITADREKSGSHVLHIAVVERAIIYTRAPGSNGDKEFYDILRKLTTGTGQSIGTINAGSSTPYSFVWKVDVTAIKKEQVAVVAWVQDGSTKAMVNAGMSIPTFFIDAPIAEKSTSVKNGYTHYIACSIKNDNQTTVSTKITIRDSTRSAYTNTSLGWVPEGASSGEPVLVDSIVTSINAGDSLVFWSVTTTPAATGAKAVLELFAENRSDSSAYGWGCVRYLNLSTNASGTEYPKPEVTDVYSHARRSDRSASIIMRGNLLEYSLPAAGPVAVSLYSLDGAVALSPVSGTRQQGTHTVDLGYSKLNSGMYIARCRFNGKTVNRLVAYCK